MIAAKRNTSRILRNPSRRSEGFGLSVLQIRSIGGRNGESVTNPSRVRVKDLGRRKSINNRYISLSSINTSRSPAPARAMRVRTREGVCEGLARRIRSTSSVRQRHSLRRRLHTLARVGQGDAVAPTFPSRCPTQRVATRWPTCDLPVWQTNRYFPELSRRDWPAGTGTKLTTVCFACPTRNQNHIQKGKAMSESTHLDSSSTTHRHHIWHSIVAPTARAIERFMWRMAWFGLFVWILLHCHHA